MICVSSRGSEFALLHHSSAKNLQILYIRMKPQFFSSKGLLWFAFCPPLTFALEKHFAADKLSDPSPPSQAAFDAFVLFSCAFPPVSGRAPFPQSVQLLFSVHHSSAVPPPGKRLQHRSLMERARLLAEQSSCLPLG